MSLDTIRTAAENDLSVFAKLVGPHRVYGSVHEDLFNWWTREEAVDNQLVLLPRDHQKSHCLAVRIAWEITRNPAITILYVSATSALAEKQLYSIKNILTSPVYKRYWPEMVDKDEGKREKWTTTEISVDHPKRKEEGVRDSTILSAGLTTNTTGFHCDIAALDDVVVPNNVNTGEGRAKVAAMYSQLASIETTDAKEIVVGTRYDPRDLYSTMLSMEEEVFDKKGNIVDTRKVYEIYEKAVEDSPERDGSGQFLWPRQRRKDGKHFGFDRETLARKKAKYVDRYQFFAQYYNDPNDAENAPISTSWFQYYDKKYLEQRAGNWYIKGKRINVFAAMDFAFSKRKRADFTAIVVIGIDSDNNIYMLDIDRFKTTSIREMFDHVLTMHTRWGFRKLRAEISAAQSAVVTEFRHYMSDAGVFFSIDEYRPTRYDGTKEERIDSTLSPRYENMKVWHYRGGNCQVLEDELVQSRPEHDDVKDALAAVVVMAKPPASMLANTLSDVSNKVVSHSRFGGVRRVA